MTIKLFQRPLVTRRSLLNGQHMRSIPTIARLTRSTARPALRTSTLLNRSLPLLSRRLPPSAHFQPSTRSFWSFSSSSSAAAAAAASLMSASASAGLGPNSIPHVDPSLLPVLFAILLSVIAPSHADDGEDEDGNDTLHNPPWTVVDFSGEGKGFGAVAARDIAAGERLIAERPVCVWPQGLSAERARKLFEEMDERAKKVFMELARTEGRESILF